MRPQRELGARAGEEMAVTAMTAMADAESGGVCGSADSKESSAAAAAAVNGLLVIEAKGHPSATGPLGAGNGSKQLRMFARAAPNDSSSQIDRTLPSAQCISATHECTEGSHHEVGQA